MIKYYDLIHCNTQEETTAVIDKLNRDRNLTWLETEFSPYIDNPSEFELQKGFFKQKTSDLEGSEFYISVVKIDDETKMCLVYIIVNETDPEKLKLRLINTDCEESISELVILEASEFLNEKDKLFSINYEVYDENANHITTIYSLEDLSKLIKEVYEEPNKKYIIYVGSEEIVIDNEHNIDYYDERICF